MFFLRRHKLNTGANHSEVSRVRNRSPCRPPSNPANYGVQATSPLKEEHRLTRKISSLALCHRLKERLRELPNKIIDVPKITPLDDLPVLQFMHRRKPVLDGLTRLKEPLLRMVEEHHIAIRRDAVGRLNLLRDVIPSNRETSHNVLGTHGPCIFRRDVFVVNIRVQTALQRIEVELTKRSPHRFHGCFILFVSSLVGHGLEFPLRRQPTQGRERVAVVMFVLEPSSRTLMMPYTSRPRRESDTLPIGHRE